MTPPSNASADSAQGMAESAIAQPEQLFRTIFEQAAVGVALIETSTGRFVLANPRYCEIVDLSQEHMTATTFMAITHPDDLQADLDNMETLKAGHVREFSMEKRYVKSDGSIVWVSLVVSPLWNIGDEQKFHIAVVQEITTGRETALSVAQSRATLEQEVAQQLKEAQDSRRQLQAIFEGTSDAVYLKDVQGRYLMFNEAASRYTGKCSGAVLGKDDRFLFPLAEAQALMAQDQRIVSGGKTLTYEETVTTVDGVMRTFQTTKGPMFDAEGGITGLFGISRDITERTQAEVALRESEERFQSVFEHAAT